jgi:hypothetical protein
MNQARNASYHTAAEVSQTLASISDNGGGGASR